MGSGDSKSGVKAPAPASDSKSGLSGSGARGFARYPVAVGDVIGEKYRLDEVVGASGMGVVFAATHLQIEQKVAIKFLLDKGGHLEEAMRRFALEAKVMGKIRSRHVVRILDVGSVNGRVPYIVMEYLDGEDLGRLSKRAGPMAVPEAVSYVLQACEGLAAAHAVGVIHRDIKPSNLFVAGENDGTRSLKVIDFGVAKFRGIDTSSSNGEARDGSLTQTATIIGSPRYMSPEQATESRDVDGSTDVWSLGVILHELVSGHALFKAESLTEVLVRVLGMPIPRLDAVVPGVPAGLADVVDRALQRDRAKRIPTMVELARAIAPFAGSRESIRVGRIQHVADSSASLKAMLAEQAAAAIPREPSEATGTTRTWESQNTGSGLPRRRGPAAAVAVVCVGIALGAGGWLIKVRPWSKEVATTAPTKTASAEPPPPETTGVPPTAPADSARASIQPAVAPAPTSSANAAGGATTAATPPAPVLVTIPRGTKGVHAPPPPAKTAQTAQTAQTAASAPTTPPATPAPAPASTNLFDDPK